ncbi:unnamed protein product [Spirodela intermedia]|uniref:Uncharacterized protein n=1 Tax=Spirodela intermedia TaxID=51605 RepID=A0A7I8KBE3_SPIIN|nr:unnamed protein product [Spirodela intermedia]
MALSVPNPSKDAGCICLLRCHCEY